jgi:hypothetical protein
VLRWSTSRYNATDFLDFAPVAARRYGTSDFLEFVRVEPAPAPRTVPHSTPVGPEADGPDVDYIVDIPWPTILLPHRFTLISGDGIDYSTWRGPHKDSGSSSITTNHSGTDGLFCFSSSLEPTFYANQWCSKFVAFARLNHGGDRVAAADALRRLGYTLKLVEPLREADSPAPATRPIVHNIDEALATIRDIADTFEPGRASLHVQTWPGFGKTTTLGRLALERIAARRWPKGAFLVLGERSLVLEKASALRSHARQYVGSDDFSERPVEVRTFLGRDDNPEGGSWCEHADAVRHHTALWLPACMGCPALGDGARVKPPKVRGVCATERGRYHHQRNGALGSQGLTLATLDALRGAWTEVPNDVPLILDDIGPGYGLIRVVRLRADDVKTALERIEDWRSAVGVLPMITGKLPEVAVADVAIAVLAALARGGRFRTEQLERAVRALPDPVRQAVAAGEIAHPTFGKHAIGWPWEVRDASDEPDGLPALTALALRLATEVLQHEAAPLIERELTTNENGDVEIAIYMPDRELIARARAGFVVWLSVAPMPPEVLEALGAHSEIVYAAPEGLQVVVPELRVPTQDGEGERIVRFGPGNRRAGAPSAEDELVRAIARACAERLPSFGAVLHKADREALGSPDWCRSFGSGHAGTDDLAGRRVLALRRFQIPYYSLAVDAAALRRALGIRGELTPKPGRRVDVVTELRRWSPDSDPVRVKVPADPLTRALLAASEAHTMLNACGRSRALSASEEGRTILVLSGVPFHLGGPAVQVRPMRDVLAELDVLDAVTLPTQDARRAALKTHHARAQAAVRVRQNRILALLAATPGMSQHGLAATLQCSKRTIERDLRALGLTTPEAAAFASLRPTCDTRHIEEERGFSMQRLSQVGHLPTAEALAAALDQDGGRPVSRRSVRRLRADLLRALRDGTAIVPKHRTKARTLERLAAAALRLQPPSPTAASRAEAFA